MSQWYYQLLGEEFGPVTAEALRELIQEGTISESDPVRPVDSADWRPASSCEELQGTDDDVISDLSELSFEFEESGPTARRTVYGTEVPEAATEPEAVSEVKKPAGYCYQVQGVSVGPIPLQSLVQLAAGGRLLASDLVQAEGDRAWRTAVEYSELAVIFAAQVQSAAAVPEVPAKKTVADSEQKKPAGKSAGSAGKGRRKSGRGPVPGDTAAVDDILNEVFAEEEPQPPRRGGLSGMGSGAAETASAPAPVVASAAPPTPPVAAPVTAMSTTAAAAAKSYKAPPKPRKSSGGGMSLEFGTPARAVLGVVIAGVLFWFSGPLMKVFKSDYDRYAKRTELAIQTIEALNPKTQLVAYKGQMMSVEKELGAYATAIKSSGTPSGKTKHLLDALDKMLEFAKMDPKEADKQKQAVSEAKALIQQYRGG